MSTDFSAERPETMRNETFFQDRRLPFVECRYSRSSRSEFKPHIHAAVSIGAVETGLVEYSAGGLNGLLSPGSLALINPETLHSCNTVQAAERSYSMFYLDVHWCLTIQKSLWETDSFVPFNVIKLDDEPLYRHYCLTLRHLLSPDVHLQEKEQLLVELVSTVFEQSCTPRTARKSCPGDIERLKRLLKDDLARDLTLDSLADTLGTNPYALLRKFKAETGITPHAYRLNRRIELAKEYLRQGRDIAETALECGFFDQSHLHRHFKAMTTVTPRDYRMNFENS